MGVGRGWLLDFGNFQAAVGAPEMLHLLDTPKLYGVPGSPAYCQQVLIWQNHILPVMDLSVRLSHHLPPHPGTERKLVGIVAYETTTEVSTQFGSLLLDAIPRQIVVEDEQACPKDQQTQRLGSFVISCFTDGSRVIPILDLTYVFSGVN